MSNGTNLWVIRDFFMKKAAAATLTPMSIPRPEPILQVHGLHFAYPGQAPLFANWSADLPAGLTRLEGDAGSGKSTLLRLLAGELHGQGQFMLAGQRLAPTSAAWRQRVCHIDPRDAALDELTPAELMHTQRALHPGLDESAWQAHLAAFDLLMHMSKPFYALSSGSRRKAALAVALSAGCPLTLLDEPTAGLDSASRRWLMQSLTACSSQAGRAWLVSSDMGLDDALPWVGCLQL